MLTKQNFWWYRNRDHKHEYSDLIEFSLFNIIIVIKKTREHFYLPQEYWWDKYKQNGKRPRRCWFYAAIFSLWN